MWKYKEEYKLDKPETIGETDYTFDLDNYREWLEEQLTKCRKQLSIANVVKSLRDEMAIGFAQTKMQVWDGELTNKHREEMLEDWIRRNGDDLTIAEHIVKDAYFLSDEMLKHR